MKLCKEGCPGCRLDEINNAKTGIPYLNFFYIWVVCLCSTLPIQSLFPYLYFMIRDLKVAKQEQDIGFYAGFVGATYFLARTISAVPWGMFADKYGRKPCIVISILSVIIFNTLFGLSTTYWMAIVTRGLLGLLCGILGPIKAYASEVCRKEHQALGISLVTSSRAIAFVIGPAIGGFLSQPANKYPNIFSQESIFGRFPYFLPCFAISVLAAGACVACIWLPETLHMHRYNIVEACDGMEAQVADSSLYGKPKQSWSERFASTKSLLKNWHLISSIIIYCIFSLYDTAYYEIFSLWAVSSRKYHGLSFTSQDVGTVLAISGFGILVYQLLMYPFLAKYVGLMKPFRSAAVLSILVIATYPFMANLHGMELKVLVNIASLLKNIFAATITTVCNILQNTAVTQEHRGVANGISVTLMSIFKAVGPAAAGILFSWSQKNVTGLFLPGDHILYLLLNMVAVIGLALTFKPFFSMPSAMK
ncbi:probable peptide/nitrate transporter At3g43790 [Lolium rigidum]|uniref:probable peptide/nitrate transporter At3g43790 n=1 Tax=Lolium rigidum TaxID=89674 RepID=UPI001F5C8597|nr:probable peptide/nitrate transporter At3g43790 [Lolium rigidum]